MFNLRMGQGLRLHTRNSTDGRQVQQSGGRNTLVLFWTPPLQSATSPVSDLMHVFQSVHSPTSQGTQSQGGSGGPDVVVDVPDVDVDVVEKIVVDVDVAVVDGVVGVVVDVDVGVVDVDVDSAVVVDVGVDSGVVDVNVDSPVGVDSGVVDVDVDSPVVVDVGVDSGVVDVDVDSGVLVDVDVDVVDVDVDSSVVDVVELLGVVAISVKRNRIVPF